MGYDIFVVAVLIVGMVRGAVRGVVWQLAGIAGIVLCLVFAETISHIGSPLVNLEPPLNQWVVMFVAYLFFSFLSFGFARLINSALEKAELKEYNKHLGAIFGLVKGAALCLVITFFLVTLSETTRDMLRSSKSARYAAIIMDRLHPVMPEKLRGALDKYIHDLDAPDLDLHFADGDHDHSGGGSPWVPDAGDQPASPDGTPAGDPSGSSGQPTAPTTADALDRLLQQIPGLANDSWTRQTIALIYEATPPERRQQLLEDLKTAGPAMLWAVVQKWQSQPAAPQSPSGGASTPAGPAEWGSTEPVGYSQPPAPSRAQLVTAIASLLARQPQDQPAYEQYISERLTGLPDAVIVGVLQDWKADLTQGATDPDPQTNASTSLDRRIISQLTIQRVSVYQLSQELQNRLMQARTQ
jgi:uncharacterized membrane protein required for colicin V production